MDEISYKGLSSNILWIGLSKFLTYIIPFLVNLIIINSLTKEDYGILSLILQFLSISLIVGEFGLNTTLVNFIPKLKIEGNIKKIKRIISKFVIIRIIISFFLSTIFFLIFWYLKEILNIIFVYNYFLLIFIIFIFQNIINILSCILISFQKMKLYAIYTLIEKTLYSIGICILIFIYFLSILNILLVYIIIYGISNLYLIFMNIKLIRGLKLIRKPLNNKLSNKTNLKNMLFFSIYIYIINIISIIPLTFSNFYINSNYSLTDLASYALSYSIITMISQFLSGIPGAFFPFLSEKYSKRDINLKDNVNNFIKYILIITSFMSIIVFSFSNQIIQFFFPLYGEDSKILLSILSFLIIFLTLSYLFERMMMVIRKEKRLLVINFISVILYIILMISMGRLFNIFVIPIIQIIFYAIKISLIFINLKELLCIKMNFKIFLKILLIILCTLVINYIYQIFLINISLFFIIFDLTSILLITLFLIKYLKLLTYVDICKIEKNTFNFPLKKFIFNFLKSFI
ncbi:MAG: oligosaccharide flippase family protein [Candidatus Helarchaeota archaeon]